MNNQNTLHIGNIGHSMSRNTAELINTKNLTSLTADSIEFKDRVKGVTSERIIKFRLGDIVYTLVAKDESACYDFEKKLETVKQLTGNGSLLTNVVFKELLVFALVESVMVDSVHFTMTDKYTISRDKFPNIWEKNLINTPHDSTGYPPLNIIGNGGGVTSKSDPNYMLCRGAS